MSVEAEALSLPPRQAIRFFAEKISVGTQRWDDLWRDAHSRAFMVAGVQAGDVLEGVRTALGRAIAQGTTLAEFRRDLGPLMQRLGWEAKGKGYAAWRTRLVYETNLRGAYAAGEYEQATDPDVLAALPFWRYRHSGARDARPQHVAWDGLVLRHDDAWWASHYPPNGWGCGCWVEPLTPGQAARAGGVVEAPEIIRRPWRDPVSGRTDMVPIGIDPGWDYNVGQAWRTRQEPGNAYAVPVDWPPAAPAAPVVSAPSPPVVSAPPSPVVSPPAALGTDAPPPGRTQPARVRTEVRRAEASAAVRAEDAALRDAYSPWRQALSAGAMAAIRAYRSPLGQSINKAMRGDLVASPAILAAAAEITAALNAAITPRAVVVHRGMGAAAVAAIGAVGTQGRFAGFTSTSIDRAVAADFARRRGGRVIELRLPADLRGAAYIQMSTADRPQQYELLLAAGLGYRVISRTNRRIVLEVFHVGAGARGG